MEIPQDIIEQSINRGSILHADFFSNIDHGKFFVIIGVSQEFVAGFFFINSNINKSLYKKQALLNLQYPLKHRDYPFLRYDSFVSAIEIQKIPKERLAKSISKGQTKIIGDLRKEHIDELLESVRESDLFTNIEKKQFLYE